MNTRIICTERDGQWIARAFRADTGDPFGVERVGPTQKEAVEELERWLAWQREHAAALQALQEAERDYHRTAARSAFAGDGAFAIELQKESLRAVDAARVRLDEIRGRRPEA
jgi:hypothetical protein